MSKAGGKREGAGRPAGSMNPATIARKLMEEKILTKLSQHFDKILDEQIDLAVGPILKKFVRGKMKKIKMPGDVQAGKFLIEQAVGKAKERVEVTGADGSSIKMTWEK